SVRIKVEAIAHGIGPWPAPTLARWLLQARIAQSEQARYFRPSDSGLLSLRKLGPPVTHSAASTERGRTRSHGSIQQYAHFGVGAHRAATSHGRHRGQHRQRWYHAYQRPTPGL